jgi:hypothetical protein
MCWYEHVKSKEKTHVIRRGINMNVDVWKETG